MYKPKEKIYQKKDGLWYYTGRQFTEDLTVTNTEEGGYPDRQAAEEASRKDAGQFEAVYGTVMDPQAGGHFTLKTYLIYWYHRILVPRSDDSTKMTRWYVLYRYILPNLGEYADTELAKVTPFLITQLISRCGREHQCKTEANQVQSFLSSAFMDAFLDGHIRDNPMTRVELQPRPKPEEKIVYNEAQLKKLVHFCISDYPSVKLELFLALFCGLRIGEIRGLRFDDCDESTLSIHISRQVVTDVRSVYTGDSIHRERTGVAVKAPKTKTSNRVIRVHPVIFQALEERKNFIEETGKKGIYWTEESEGFVAVGRHGRIISVSTMNMALKLICERTGLPRVSVHGLRHMAATLMYESCLRDLRTNPGKNNPGSCTDVLRRISHYLGHKNERTTYEIYLHDIYGLEQIRSVTEQLLSPGNRAAGKAVRE